jgi:hypothetical protein
MYKCKFLDWKSGDLPKSEVYKPLQPKKYYGKEALTSRQMRQYDVMCGLGDDTISTPFPTWEHRQPNIPVRSAYDEMHEKIGAPLFYNKNRRVK